MSAYRSASILWTEQFASTCKAEKNEVVASRIAATVMETQGKLDRPTCRSCKQRKISKRRCKLDSKRVADSSTWADKKEPASWIYCRSHAEIWVVHVVKEESTLEPKSGASRFYKDRGLTSSNLCYSNTKRMKPLDGTFRNRKRNVNRCL